MSLFHAQFSDIIQDIRAASNFRYCLVPTPSEEVLYIRQFGPVRAATDR